ncbi:hypothetical protein ASPFODRAFT_147585, partial [Aspergillus luchuensis CBS 106.47]
PRRRFPSGDHVPCPCTGCDAIDPLFVFHDSMEIPLVNMEGRNHLVSTAIELSA